MKTKLRIATLFILSLCFADPIKAAPELAYPTRSIDMFVGFAAGGGTDLGARMLAEISKKYLGQEVVVTNKPGGNCAVALTLITRSKPDGYTLGAVVDTAINFNPFIEKAHYKPLEDFTFIRQYGGLDFGVALLSSSPIRTFTELVSFARSNPEKPLIIGTVGAMSPVRVALSMIGLNEGFKITYVPFQGAAPAMTALLGGHVQLTALGASGFAPYCKAGTVRAIAVMCDQRMDSFPEVPTLKELGYALDFENRYIIVGPKNMEKSIVNRLIEVFKTAMETSQYVKLAKDLEIRAKNPVSGEELKRRLADEYSRNRQMLIKLAVDVKE